MKRRIPRDEHPSLFDMTPHVVQEPGSPRPPKGPVPSKKGSPMRVEIPDKTYFRIGEVSKILGVEPYVVRYWESEFKTVKPVRTRSDQRLYRRKDLEELTVIRNLLYQERFTIAGARKKLSEKKKDHRPPAARSAGKDVKKTLHKVRDGLREIRKMID
ncbi:MAG TPA: MerR family transcriptional regulator [Syntrophales bacterium]|jgi:DNA-binding transcriptional MerR regulator|nr:MerR family transcriptional regulator [Syntrophales bacterium]HRT62712.1 MerR family transcriptional regulator [Syntrophales bacterium]